MVNTAANCSFCVSNLPGQMQRINRLVPEDSCSCHGIVMLRKPNIHCRKQPVTWKMMARHLKSWFFAGYTRYQRWNSCLAIYCKHLEGPWKDGVLTCPKTTYMCLWHNKHRKVMIVAFKKRIVVWRHIKTEMYSI